MRGLTKMRRSRISLACALVGAAMVTAAFGACSASATELCKVTSTSTCPSGSVYPKESAFKGIGVAEFAGKKCDLEIAFQTTALSGTPLPAEITAFPFSNCPTGVTITAVNLHWSLLIEASGPPNGFGKIFQLGTTNPVELKVVGLGPSACIYELPSFTPSIIGGATIFTTMTAQLVGSGCSPTTPTFTFKIPLMPAFYVTS
jgi:hypothetical protein